MNLRLSFSTSTSLVRFLQTFQHRHLGTLFTLPLFIQRCAQQSQVCSVVCSLACSQRSGNELLQLTRHYFCCCRRTAVCCRHWVCVSICEWSVKADNWVPPHRPIRGVLQRAGSGSSKCAEPETIGRGYRRAGKNSLRVLNLACLRRPQEEVLYLVSHCFFCLLRWQAIYDRALTPRELFVSTGLPTNARSPNLLAYYSFDEGHGVSILDRREPPETARSAFQSRAAPSAGTFAASALTPESPLFDGRSLGSIARVAVRNDALLMSAAGTVDLTTALQSDFFVISVSHGPHDFCVLSARHRSHLDSPALALL